MVSNLGTLLASGTNVTLRYVRERTRNTTPAALSTPITSLAAAATSGSGAGFSDFTRSSGSFEDDGLWPGQKVTTSGFTTGANNGTWIVDTVTALTLTVRDTNDVVVDETADAAQQMVIRLNLLRATGRNVNLEKNILESEEVDEDGQENDSRHGFNRVVGSPGFQLSREDYDDFIELVMGQDWDEGFSVTGTPDLGVTGSLRFSRSAGSFVTDGFRLGDIIRTTGFSNTTNNGDWRVTRVDATLITVVSTSDGVTKPVAESEAGGKDIALPGKRIDIGTCLATILVERAFSDIGQFQDFNGVTVDQMVMNAEPESIIGGTFNLLGMSAVAMATSSASASDPATPSGTRAPMAAFDGEIYEGTNRNGVATAMNFTLARNRSLNPVIGSKTSPDVFQGTARISGTLTVYFADAVLFNKFVNETESTIWVRFDDPNDPSKFFNIVFPRTKYNGAPMDPPQEGPVPIEMPFRALKASGLAVPGGTTRNSMMTIQVGNSLDI